MTYEDKDLSTHPIIKYKKQSYPKNHPHVILHQELSMGDKKPNCEDLFDSKKVYNKIGPDYKLRVTESRKQ